MCIPKVYDEPLRLPQGEWVFEEELLEGIEQVVLEEALEEFIPYFNDEPNPQPEENFLDVPLGEVPQLMYDDDDDCISTTSTNGDDRHITSVEDVFRMERYVQDLLGGVECLITREIIEDSLRELMRRFRQSELTTIEAYTSLLALENDIVHS